MVSSSDILQKHSIFLLPFEGAIPSSQPTDKRCIHNSQEELLDTTWERLTEAGRVPPPLIKERFCRKLEKDDIAAAVSSIIGHHMKELQEPFSKMAWLNLLKENSGRFQRESLVILMDEANILMSRTNMPNPVIENLLTSCKDFLRTHTSTVAEISVTETATAIQALKS